MTVAVSTMMINSLVNIGERGIDGSLTTAEGVYYLRKMNTMLDAWSIERLMCYAILQESFALTVDDGTYTIGSGGDFNTTRPTKIVSAFLRDSSSSDTPITILPFDRYDAIVNKSVTGSYPTYLFYDAAFVSGLGTIKLYPLPLSGLTLYINSWQQLQQFANVSTALSLPPGYQRAIESNFSIECAPGYIKISAELAKIARESKAAIKSINLPDSIMRLDVGVVRGTRGSILEGP